MKPTNKEIQQHKTCQLYAYLLASLGKEIPDEIDECVDSYDYLVDCVSNLSEAIKDLDSDTFDKIVNNTQSSEARDLYNWWEMQKEADKLRRALFSDV